jgi:hypothetical protein
VAEGFVCKLSDFGESKDLSMQTMTVVGCESPLLALQARINFCAPEVLRGERYNESADAFSFALTLVACFKKGRPYDHTESFKLNDVKHARMRPYIPFWNLDGTGAPRSLHKLLRRCWLEKAKDRPSFDTVVHELTQEVERIARKKVDAVALAAAEKQARLLGAMSRDAQFLHEIREREVPMRATFECADGIDDDEGFVAELREAVEEIRSFSVDPLVYAALIMTHDESGGFLCGKEQEEEDARKEKEREDRQRLWDEAHAHEPDAPPAEWADDEVVEAVVTNAVLRRWVWACAKAGVESEEAYVEELGKKINALEAAEAKKNAEFNAEFDKLGEDTVVERHTTTKKGGPSL